MNSCVYRELMKIYILLVIYQKPTGEQEILLNLKRCMDIDAPLFKQYFSLFKNEGNFYSKCEELDGQIQTVYYITQKGKNRLGEFFNDMGFN